MMLSPRASDGISPRDLPIHRFFYREPSLLELTVVPNQEASTVDQRQAFAPDLRYCCVSQESNRGLVSGCQHCGVYLFAFGSGAHPFFVSAWVQCHLRKGSVAETQPTHREMNRGGV